MKMQNAKCVKCVLIEKLPSKVLSHTRKFDWICRGAESFTLDTDGKSVFQLHR